MATLTPEIFGKAGRIRPRATGELPAGSMGARDIEVLSEAMFCFYFAIWRSRKKTEYLTRSGRGWEIWKYITTVSHVRSFAKQLNISSMVNRVMIKLSIVRLVKYIIFYLEIMRNGQVS